MRQASDIYIKIIRPATLSSWLLVGLLLLGQASLLAHQSGHDIGVPHNSCVVCLGSTVLNTACPPCVATLVYHPTPAAPVIDGHIDTFTTSYLLTSTAPRAPPSCS
jgi:hypothetical protein